MLMNLRILILLKNSFSHSIFLNLLVEIMQIAWSSKALLKWQHNTTKSVLNLILCIKTDKTVVGLTKGQTRKRAIFINECAPILQIKLQK